MALYDIEFHRVEHYYLTETIEAGSREEAAAIACELMESYGFNDYLCDASSYEEGENEFLHANDARRSRATMTADEIKKFMED